MGIHYIFFTDDLGIASSYPSIKNRLSEPVYNHVSLFYCSIKNQFVFVKELEILRAHFPAQLFISLHSKGVIGSCFIEEQDIEAVMNANTMQHIEFTISGNEIFVEKIKESLFFLGIKKVQIQEQYFSE